jgi:hypothetical protein
MATIVSISAPHGHIEKRGRKLVCCAALLLLASCATASGDLPNFAVVRSNVVRSGAPRGTGCAPAMG